MGFDFKALLSAEPRKDLKAEVTEQMWADLGRRVYHNIMDEKFIKALVNAQLGAVTAATRERPPQQELARMVRAYIFSGTIAR